MDEKVHILSNYLLSPRVLSELRISILPYLTALVELRAWKSFLKVFFLLNFTLGSGRAKHELQKKTLKIISKSELHCHLRFQRR